MTAPTLACPCCGCLTLSSHGNYEICPVCFWEDDLTVDPEDDLNPNNMSLFDARANLAAWGAVNPELVHWTRPPRLDEAPEGFPHRGERPYDRWPTLPVGTGIRFGWIGPSPTAFAVRDGFLVLDDGRRVGLRVREKEGVPAPVVQPADLVGRDRDGGFEVWIPDGPDTRNVLAALRAGLAAEIVRLLPGPPDAPWAPHRVSLGSDRTYGGGGEGDVRWEGSPDEPDRVAPWAEAQLRALLQPGDEFVVLGPRSWVLRRRGPQGLSVWGIAVHDVAAGRPPGGPPTLPPGTRCLLEWSSGLFPVPPR